MDQGLLIEICPDIIKLIFELLGSKDLNTCAQVCSLWYNIAKSEKKRRDKIVNFFEVDLAGIPKNTIESAFIKLMENIKCCPNFCTLFMTIDLSYAIDFYFSSFNVYLSSPEKKLRGMGRNLEILGSLLRQYLPPKCLVTFATLRGIVDPSAEIHHSPVFSGLLLPNFPGMTVSQYYIRKDKMSDVNAFLSGIPDVKCVLMLIGLDLHDGSTLKVLTAACSRVRPPIAFGSVFLDDYRHYVGGEMVDLPDDNEEIAASLTVFSGVGVQSASLMIDATEELEEMKTKLELFQKTGIMQNRCFAYMFASCLGLPVYRTTSKSPSWGLFKKMYPDVPIIGLYCFRSCWRKYLPNVHIDEKVLFPKGRNFRFSDEVSFTVVSVKNEMK